MLQTTPHPQSQWFITTSHTTTHHSLYDSFGRVISSSQRHLPYNTRRLQQKNIHFPGGILTQNFSRRVAQTHFFRWVHTCNVTAYRNAVTLQVTDTIRSEDLNSHPLPHDVTVSCEHVRTCSCRKCIINPFALNDF
jgi:cyclophilin family peptidyl-prolyl cis-trans isomerase